MSTLAGNLLLILPAAFVAIAWWTGWLVLALPVALLIYVQFAISLFLLPATLVLQIWLGFAILTLVPALYKFPGQYTPASALSLLLTWPLTLPAAVIVDREEEAQRTPPAAVPNEFEATVTFIDGCGTEQDLLMVFFEEFQETAFYCDGALEREHGLAEDLRFEVVVDVRRIDEVGDEELWIESIRAAD